MTSTTDQKPPAPTNATLCLQLGWSMQRLYRARPQHEKEPAGLPDHLPGLSRLTRLRRVEIDYGRASTCLAKVASGLSWPGGQTPDISKIAGCLDVFGVPDGRTRPVATSGDPVEDFRKAVLAAHLAVITKLAAGDAPLGKAYVLGRALADTCRGGQDSQDLQDNFEPHRLAQLSEDLSDLASELPAHSAKAVARSLTWWRDAVYIADDSEAGQRRRQQLGNVRTDAPELRNRVILNPKVSNIPASGDLDAILQALPRQGELWRVVLTGEKNPLDLLTPDDYLRATRRAIDQGRRVAASVITAAPKVSITVFGITTAILAGVIFYIENSHASHGGKLAAFLVAVGGYLVTLTRAVAPRLKSAATAIEAPLWHAALDYVSAEGISIPPVGQPDPAGWSQLSGAASGNEPGPH